MTATLVVLSILLVLALLTPLCLHGWRAAHRRASFSATVKRTMPGARAADDFDRSLGESFGPVAAYAEINLRYERSAGGFLHFDGPFQPPRRRR